MKLYFMKLFFFAAASHFLFLDSNAVDGQDDMFLLSDGTVKAEKRGDDVSLTGTGSINLTIPSGKLQFEVCSSCAGASHVCYESLYGLNNAEAVGSCIGISSTCEFKVFGDETELKVGKIPFIGFTGCLKTFMKYDHANVEEQVLSKIKSCSPKFDNDQMIKLFVQAVSNCPITVKNAQVHVPKILTTLPPQTAPRKETTPTSPGQAKESTADAGFPWWAYLIIAAGCLLALIFIGVVVYFICCKKPKSSKALPPPETVVTSKVTKKVKVSSPDVQPPTTTTAAAPVETNDTPASTRKEDLNFTKFEPSKKSKKIQKKGTTTQEPTEDAPPAPGSRQPVFDLSNAPEPVPVPYLKPHRLVPRSMKSAKTDSLEKTLPKEKKELIEPLAQSAARHCLKSSESNVIQEMKTNYPEIKRDVLEAEVGLLGLPVGKMFAEIGALARESEQKLLAAGCEFDEGGCITSVPESARQMLQDEKTPATAVYFAFGAEYHQYLSENNLNPGSYSLPLLMVVALQRRFEDRIRRKACALIRRKMPIVLANYTEAARQKMSYPMNAIEKAYCRNPIPFRKLSDIKTDSEGEKRTKEAAERKKTVPGGGRDAKRKKKSSKKRH